MFAFPNAPSGPSQQPRYRKLIKQLLMNTIVLKGTRHEMRMGPSTTISEKMIFVSPERLPSPAAQRRIRPSVVEKHATFSSRHFRIAKPRCSPRLRPKFEPEW